MNLHAATTADGRDRKQLDMEMFGHMSQEGWELVGQIALRDGLPRLAFKRRLR